MKSGGSELIRVLDVDENNLLRWTVLLVPVSGFTWALFLGFYFLLIMYAFFFSNFLSNILAISLGIKAVVKYISLTLITILV